VLRLGLLRAARRRPIRVSSTRRSGDRPCHAPAQVRSRCRPSRTEGAVRAVPNRGGISNGPCRITPVGHRVGGAHSPDRCGSTRSRPAGIGKKKKKRRCLRGLRERVGGREPQRKKRAKETAAGRQTDPRLPVEGERVEKAPSSRPRAGSPQAPSWSDLGPAAPSRGVFDGRFSGRRGPVNPRPVRGGGPKFRATPSVLPGPGRNDHRRHRNQRTRQNQRQPAP